MAVNEAIATSTIPHSPLFQIRQTPHAGRAVFATRLIAKETALTIASDLSLNIILRAYRKEVCAHCFLYNLGSTLPVRCALTGFVFCSPPCLAAWRQNAGNVGVAAWTAAEILSKSRSGDLRSEDWSMVDPDLPRPIPGEIVVAWEGVKLRAELIRRARAGAEGKMYRKAVSSALSIGVDPDVLAFCVCAVLERHRAPEHWAQLLELVPDATPYHNTADLEAFTRSYLQMLAVLPAELLEVVTPETLIVASSRDSHNVFGIRSLGDEGSELFGYGCWGGASFFNHSCGPNVRKERVGREWRFVVDKEVRDGEELCISYLSVDERLLETGGRKEKLSKAWGFECRCPRCEGKDAVK